LPQSTLPLIEVRTPEVAVSVAGRDFGQGRVDLGARGGLEVGDAGAGEVALDVLSRLSPSRT